MGLSTEVLNTSEKGTSHLEKQRILLRVKVAGWEPYGIRQGDWLEVEPTLRAASGDLVVLEMDGRKLVRQLVQLEKSLLLQPLAGNLAQMDWPLFEPLPLVGVVRRVIRNL